MWFPTYNGIFIIYLCLLSVLATFSTQFCGTPEGTSKPTLADCVEALGQIPSTNEMLKQPQNSNVQHIAATFETRTCVIYISDYTPAGLKAVDKSAVVRWDEIHNLTETMVWNCSLPEPVKVTGGVVIIGKWVEVKCIKVV